MNMNRVDVYRLVVDRVQARTKMQFREGVWARTDTRAWMRARFLAQIWVGGLEQVLRALGEGI